MNQRLLILPLLSLLLLGCSSNTHHLSLDERLHNAYLDVIEAKEENIRPLVNLNEQENKVDYQDGRVLLFTLHRFPSSYPTGENITFNWDESWLCSVKELNNWYIDNKSNIKDPLLRVKQLLGMSHDSPNTYISSMWINPLDVIRPAYITDVNTPMALSFDQDETDNYKTWFASQYYYSYEVKKLPWTRLGYTYDWSEEAKDKYGLSEFVAFRGTEVTVDKTLEVQDFLESLVN